MNDKIKNLLEKVNKKVGSTVLQVASEATAYEFLDTPFATINNLIGGIPLGRFTTIAGPEHTGKGAFCLHLIAYQQSKDPNFIALWTDAENSFEPEWARQLGVDLDRLILQKYTPDADIMETLLDAGLKLIKESQAIGLWVIDSIGALVPKADLYDSKDTDKGLEGMKMLNLQVKMGEFYRKANTVINRNAVTGYKGCAALLIGQVYTVPDAHVALQEVRGGNAVKHWAHLRLVLRRGPKSEWPEAKEIIGIDGKKYKTYPGWAGRFKVEKTRINKNEGKEVSISFMHGTGFDSFNSSMNAAFGLGLFERTGPRYACSIFPELKWLGREAVVEHFQKNKEDFDKLKEACVQAALTSVVTSDNAEDVEEVI